MQNNSKKETSFHPTMVVAGDCQRLRLSKSMLPLMLAFAQPLAAASASLRSMQPGDLAPRARARHAAPDVCFIHVGKTGGDSVSMMLKEAFDKGLISSYVATHDDGFQTPETWKWKYCKWFGGLRPSKCEGPPGEGPTMQRHAQKHGNAEVDFHAQCGDCLLNQCNATGHVVMWVRDPVARLISIWNAGSSITLAGKGEAVLSVASELGLPIHEDKDGARAVDLGVALDTLASRDDAVSSMRKLIAMDKHLKHDTNWFMGAENNNDVSTCKALAATVNFACVGRTERWADDWERCASSGLGLAKEWSTLQPVHSHHWGIAGKQLTRRAVQLVRDAYANELECLRALHAQGHIPDDGWLEDVLSITKGYYY